MSLTSYRAAPPRANLQQDRSPETKMPPLGEPAAALKHCEWALVHAASKAWRRPTLPQLKLVYHRRCPVSRPSSGGDRVGHGRYGHQAMVTAQKHSRNRALGFCSWRHLAEV